MVAKNFPPLDSKPVINDLKQLRELTSNPEGAQRICWGPVWRTSRSWFTDKVKNELGLSVRTDSAGNNWVTLPGESREGVIIGSHLDSVPNGGWLDGCFGVIMGLGALRRQRAAGRPAKTLHLVDWADEEGARFGRSLVGSSAASGSLNPQKELAHLVDRAGVKMPDAMKENGVDINTMMRAREELKALGAKTYLELHIEQGPVLEKMKKSTGVVLGTFGVERHMIRFIGQAAHSGSTPIAMRRDAFLAASEFALACREIGIKMCGPTPETRVVSTCGVVKVEPCIVTAVPGVCDISLDQRALSAKVLAKMNAAARKASVKAAKHNDVEVEWKTLWQIDPRPFDKRLLKLCAESVKEVTGEAPVLPSGPLHDAAEMVPHMPTVMMFSSSSRGLSHCKEEDTPIPHLDKTICSFFRLVDRAVASNR